MKKHYKKITKLGVVLFATTFIGLSSAYKSKNNNNSNLIKNTFSDVIKTNFQHQSTSSTKSSDSKKTNSNRGYNSLELNNKISQTLTEIHQAFSIKINSYKNSYPSSQEEITHQAITYLLSEITNPSQNIWYQNLFKQLTNIVNYNFQNSQFKWNINLNNKNIFPYKKYLENEKDFTQHNNNNNVTVVNTLSDQEVKTSVDTFFNTWKSYLIDNNSQNSSNNHFGFSWYNQIPQPLKPHKEYNKVFSSQDYQNIIDAIVTTRANSKIITDHGLLEEQTKVEQKLKTQLDSDKKFLEQKTNNQKQFLIDQGPGKLTKILSEISQQKVDDFKDKWHLNFSNVNDISLNSNVFENKKDDVKLVSVKIVHTENKNDRNYYWPYPSYRSLYRPDSLESKLNAVISLNNAFISKASDLEYKNNDAEVSLDEITKLIFKTIKQNLYAFIQLSPNAIENLKTYARLNQKDFVINNRLVEFLKEHNINLDITYAGATYVDRKENINKYSITLDTSGVIKDSLYNNPDYNVGINGNNEVFQYEIKPDLEQRLLDEAPRLELIITKDALTTKDLKSSIKYDNSNRIYQYQTIDAVTNYQDSLNPKLIVTTKISLIDKFVTSKFVNYTKTVLINDFKNNLTDFDLLAALAAKQIIESQRLTNLDQDLLKTIFQQSLQKTKNDPEFNNRSVDQNVNEFAKNYQDLINNNQNTLNKLAPENIKDSQDYNNLQDRLKRALIKANIDLESKFAKGLFEQINKTQKDSLVNADANLKPEFLELIDFINNSENNFDILKPISSLIQKYSPDEINLALSQTQKNLSYAFTGISSLVVISSLGIIVRGLRLNSRKYQLKKSMIITIGVMLLLISVSGLSYLLTVIL
ncbi:hypothetical protein MCAV_07410 [[Mycoplasma] cavipharyngis]|uniref:hypothetical protein n=1 Tax=[Mycoplasma] cavipharyngis TaxID=92757 RepID=UPI0037038F2D